MLRNTKGRGVLLHLLQFLHLLLLSREVRPGRSLELVSRSPSSADEITHDPAPRIESPALSRDHLSLYVDDDEYNLHAEDHQDFVPEADIHSNVSSEDMKFQNLIEEVFKLLPADRFPKKTDVVLGGNRQDPPLKWK